MRPLRREIAKTSGRLAQLGERRVRNAEVGSSSLLPSTKILQYFSNLRRHGAVVLVACAHCVLSVGRVDEHAVERLERRLLPRGRRVRVALQHLTSEMPDGLHDGVVVDP